MNIYINHIPYTADPNIQNVEQLFVGNIINHFKFVYAPKDIQVITISQNFPLPAVLHRACRIWDGTTATFSAHWLLKFFVRRRCQMNFCNRISPSNISPAFQFSISVFYSLYICGNYRFYCQYSFSNSSTWHRLDLVQFPYLAKRFT